MCPFLIMIIWYHHILKECMQKEKFVIKEMIFFLGLFYTIQFTVAWNLTPLKLLVTLWNYLQAIKAKYTQIIKSIHGITTSTWSPLKIFFMALHGKGGASMWYDVVKFRNNYNSSWTALRKELMSWWRHIS